MKRHTWIVKMIKPPPGALASEMEVSACTIDQAIAAARGMFADGFVYSAVTKKPKPEDIRKS